MNGRKGTAAKPSCTRFCQKRTNSDSKEDTYSDRPISSYTCVLRILQRFPGIPHDTVDRESRQSHRRNALENRPLHHDAPEVLDGRNMADLWSTSLCFQRLPRIRCSHRQNSRCAWMLYALVSQVGFVAFVPYVANEVCPGDTICSFDEPWMSNWAERLSNVRSVGDIAVRTE